MSRILPSSAAPGPLNSIVADSSTSTVVHRASSAFAVASKSTEASPVISTIAY